MSSTWPKKIRTKTDQFAINVCNWWRKKIRQNLFTTNWFNWQTESSTDIGINKLSSKWHTKVAQCPMMKKRTFSKKTSSKNLLGYVISKCDKFADCFFDKKTLFIRSIFEHEKKQTKPLSKQSFVLKFFLWTRRMQFCQTDRNIFGKKGTDKFLLNVRKWWRKKIGQTFFHQKLV